MSVFFEATGMIIDNVKDAMREAAQIMLKRDFSISEKGDASNLVTTSDVAVQTLLEKRLTAILPGSSFFGEEGDVPDDISEYLWVNDPIDGTANFARNLGLSVISVALLKNMEPILGLVYNPYREEMFWAEAGKGAFLNDKQIHVSDKVWRKSMLCSAMSLYDKRFAKPCFNIIEKVYNETDDLRRLGTAALEMCELAAGRVDLYFEVRLSPWDYAAASLIIKEAGGCIEMMFHDTMPLNKPSGIIAANNKENFEKLKTIVYGEIPEELY